MSLTMKTKQRQSSSDVQWTVIFTDDDVPVIHSVQNGHVRWRYSTVPSYPLLFWVLMYNTGKQKQRQFIWTVNNHPTCWRERERNVLFNDALNTFYLRLYGVRHMAKDHSDSEKGNLLPPHRLLLSINSKGSFICTTAFVTPVVEHWLEREIADLLKSVHAKMHTSFFQINFFYHS